MDHIVPHQPLSATSSHPAIKNSRHTTTQEYEPGSWCFCRQCGTRAPHQKGMPCEDITCPRCGAPMTRKF